MCENFPNIRITEGNAFALLLPLRTRTYVSSQPIDEDIDYTQLENIVFTFGGVEYPAQTTEQGVQIILPDTLAVGTYNAILTAEYFGNEIRAAYESAVTIVPWSAQSTAEQYIAGSPIVMRAAYVLNVALTDAELEALKAELRAKIEEAEQAKEEAEAAKREWEEKAADLDGVAQETTSQQILTAVENIDFSSLAKEDTALAAKDAALALAPVAQAAEAYNTGKVELAQNITAKGVQASASETLPELAQKVTAIAQQPIILSPSEVGDMYAVQQFGSLTSPNYWNLYEVLNTLRNDGRLLKYGGILLAEYCRGYDSIALEGAGAGGAYVVSDLENGKFKMYTEDITHTWATEFDGKGNRWVAYCFADEYHNFQITDTNISPRTIFIGRKVGTITSLVNGRISQIVVPDGNVLHEFYSKTFSQNFGRNFIIRNVETIGGRGNTGSTGACLTGHGNIENIYIECNVFSAGRAFYSLGNLTTAIIKAKEIRGLSNNYTFISCGKLRTIVLDANLMVELSLNAEGSAVELYIIGESVSFANNSFTASGIVSVSCFYKTNDKTKLVNLPKRTSETRACKIVSLQEGWCKPLNCSAFTNLTEENMYTYILQRLKQDEPDCGDGVTITLGSTNLAKLTSEESVQLLDDLTNIYGYTFA